MFTPTPLLKNLDLGTLSVDSHSETHPPNHFLQNKIPTLQNSPPHSETITQKLQFFSKKISKKCYRHQRHHELRESKASNYFRI